MTTATEDFFLFVEYRSQYDAVLLTYSAVTYGSGLTGKFGNSLVVDGHPETATLEDAMLLDGESLLLDVGTADESRPLLVAVDLSSGGDSLELELYSSDTPKPGWETGDRCSPFSRERLFLVISLESPRFPQPQERCHSNRSGTESSSLVSSSLEESGPFPCDTCSSLNSQR